MQEERRHSSAAEAFQSGARQYDEVARSHSHAMRLRAALGLLPDSMDAVVDLGCGPGHALAELVARASSVVAVDQSSAMLSIAQDSVAKSCHVEFVCDDVIAYCRRQTVHCAIMLGVVEYQERPLEFIRTVIARVAPEAVVIVSVPNRDNVGRRANRLISKVVARVFPKYVESVAPLSMGTFRGVWHRELSVAEVADCVEAVDARVDAVVFYNLSPFPILAQAVSAGLTSVLQRMERLGRVCPGRRLGSGFVLRIAKGRS